MRDSEINTINDSDDEAQIVELTKQPIELYKVLKFEGLVASGGEAKLAIAEGHVKLNGVVETQKRKKLVSDDVIEFAGMRYRLYCNEVEKSIEDDAAQMVQKPTVNTKRKKSMPKKAGRKAIKITS